MVRVLFATQEGAITGEVHSMPYMEARISVEAINLIDEMFMLDISY